MNITGTHFNYYLVCHRKLWLFHNQIQSEHTSDLVLEGKLIHEQSYLQRASKYTELELEGIKIDYYDAKNKVVHEVKKTRKLDDAHRWQLKYYLYKLEEFGIENPSGILEYPALRKTEEVFLSDRDKEEIKEYMDEIMQILNSPDCPGLINASRCKACAYYDFCYITEEEGVECENE